MITMYCNDNNAMLQWLAGRGSALRPAFFVNS